MKIKRNTFLVLTLCVGLILSLSTGVAMTVSAAERAGVIEVDGTTKTIEQAINESSGLESIRIMQDINFSTPIEIDKRVQIDLNGKRLTYQGSAATSAFVVNSGKYFTLENKAKAGGSLVVEQDSAIGVLCDAAAGTITLNGIVIDVKGASAIGVKIGANGSGSTINFTARINAEGNASVGIYNQASSDIYVRSGMILAGESGYSIKNDNQGRLYIEGGSLNRLDLQNGTMQQIGTSASVFLHTLKIPGIADGTDFLLYNLQYNTRGMQIIDETIYLLIPQSVVGKVVLTIGIDKYTGQIQAGSTSTVMVKNSRVKYDGNGMTSTWVPEDSSTYEKGESATVKDGRGIKKGNLTFDCWNTKADGTGTDYKANDSIVVNEDVTLYAKFKQAAAGGGEGETDGTTPSSGTLSLGAIIGISVGGFLILLIILLVILYALWHKKDKKPIGFLVPLFRKMNQLFYKTKLNVVEQKKEEQSLAAKDAPSEDSNDRA